MPAYRYKGTPVVLELKPENADAYNRVADAMTKAPEPRFLDNEGPDTNYRRLVFDLEIERPEDLEVYNEVSAIINSVIRLSGGIPCDLPRDEAPTFIPV